MNSLKKLFSDTLTRYKIESAVKDFSIRYCGADGVYDFGAVRRYSYAKYFKKYKIVNMDKNERPDVLADIQSLPFKSGSIGNIICIALLEHVQNPDLAVKEIGRVMKPHSKGLIWVPFYWREHNYPIDNCRYTAQGLSRLFERYNFKVLNVDIKSYNGLFFVASHSVRFLSNNPHKSSKFNPLLYIHALLCSLSRLDDIFNLRYNNVYTGFNLIIEKK